MPLIKYTFISGFLVVLAATTPWAQESLIQSALDSRQSIVQITAIQVGRSGSPSMAAARIAGTNRIMVARKEKVVQAANQGAGVIIAPNGLIVTNLHTILGADKIAVDLDSGQRISAQVLHVMGSHDLALLKINVPFPLIPIKFADSNKVRLRDRIVFVGTSSVLKDSLSGGYITGLATKRGQKDSIEMLQVNIDAYKGDSGGPLLDRYGCLIGMVAARLKDKKTTFAIPSNKIKKLYLDFKN